MLFYDTICRSCLNHFDVDHAYVLTTNLENFYKMTEYDCMREVEEWRKADGHRCEVCNSTNVEVFDIRVNNYKLYTVGNIFSQCRIKNEESFTLTIDKVSSNITFKMWLHRKETIAQFAVDSLIKTFESVEQIPDENFTVHPNGYFTVTMTGSIDYEKEKIFLRIEKLRYYGFSKMEILKIVVQQHQTIIAQNR